MDAGYCVYVGGFLSALLLTTSIGWLVLISSAVGGMAGGVLWTAQGAYFSRSVFRLYWRASVRDSWSQKCRASPPRSHCASAIFQIEGDPRQRRRRRSACLWVRLLLTLIRVARGAQERGALRGAVRGAGGGRERGVCERVRAGVPGAGDGAQGAEWGAGRDLCLRARLFFCLIVRVCVCARGVRFWEMCRNRVNEGRESSEN